VVPIERCVLWMQSVVSTTRYLEEWLLHTLIQYIATWASYSKRCTLIDARNVYAIVGWCKI
jgi:hypothetical protein